MAKRPQKLLDQVRDTMRRRHYAQRTEDAYCHWIRRFILYHKKQHPRDLGGPEIEQFLTFLAVERHVAASTLNQALSALLLLYRQVLQIELPPIKLAQSRRSPRLPTVLSPEEALAIIDALSGTPKLMVQLLYGSGLRITECVRLRVKDIDFVQRRIVVRNAKAPGTGSPCCLTPCNGRYKPNWSKLDACTSKTSPAALGPSLSPTRWPANTRTLTRSGAGNSSFPR